MPIVEFFYVIYDLLSILYLKINLSFMVFGGNSCVGEEIKKTENQTQSFDFQFLVTPAGF